VDRKGFGPERAVELGLALSVPVDPCLGMSVYRSGYSMRLRECLREIYPVLETVMGSEGFDALASDYVAPVPVGGDSVRWVGAGFGAFLRECVSDWDFGVPYEALADLAALEWARSEAHSSQDDSPGRRLGSWKAFLGILVPSEGGNGGALGPVRAGWDVGAVWAAVSAGKFRASPCGPSAAISCSG